MSNIKLVKNFIADSAIPAFSIAAFSTVDWHSTQAVSPTASALLGVTTDIAAAIGDRSDVIVEGLADVVFGGTVTRGDYLTSDASGRAVTAAPAAGVNNFVIGMAMASGVVGDIGQCLLSQGKIQG